MIVRNQTNDPVEYEQNGSGNEEGLAALLAADLAWEPLGAGGQKEFDARGTEPFHVVFKSAPGDPDRQAVVGGIETNDVEVVLTGFPVVKPI